MTLVAMTPAVANTSASSSEYNKLIQNIQDLDSRTPGAWRHERHNAATFTTPVGQYKIPFDTVLDLGSGITYSSANRSFTFTNGGLYAADCSIRLASGVETYLWFAPTANAVWDHGKQNAPGALNVAASTFIRVTAGQEWSVWGWSASAVNIARESSTSRAPYVLFEHIKK